MITCKKIKTDIRKTGRLKSLRQRLSLENDTVLAYIFGSYSGNRVTPLSDFDIAVLLDPARQAKALFEEEKRLFSIISGILRTDEIDLIILNTAPPGLQFSVIKNGILLFCKDADKKAIFTENVIKNYLDTAPIRQETSYHLKNRLGLMK